MKQTKYHYNASSGALGKVGGGGAVAATSGYKMDILNGKNNKFLRSKNSKFLSQIRINSTNICDFLKFIIYVSSSHRGSPPRTSKTSLLLCEL